MVLESLCKLIAKEVNISPSIVSRTLTLLEDGATVPFIARYRKEATNGLDEVQIQAIKTTNDKYIDLDKRKDTILKAIESQGKLNDELKSKIATCWDSILLEDIYLPYKQKRRTRADIARSNGLEPLAKIIMAQVYNDIESKAKRFVNKDVASAADAINGAKDIISEWVSENNHVRNSIRSLFRREATIASTISKGKEKEGELYSAYFNSSDRLRGISAHRILAIFRGEKEGFLKVNISVDADKAISSIKKHILHGYSLSSNIIEDAISDSYKRLIKPSIETEFRNDAKDIADATAIEVFAQNARQLLFAPPLGEKNVLAIDPGFRTGCKVVCLDKQGNLKAHDVIFPTAPKCDIPGSTNKVLNLVKRFKIEAIAIGNGTASRETEKFIKSLSLDNIHTYIVNESGASIYSASKVARDEFPNEDVTVRGAVSIGRRLIDPLAELVKIDPKSIGVGQYQHDVDQTKLKKSLDFVVESCVNSVGVNVNTASKELLSYVSGIGPQLAQNIVTYRAENGNFATKKDILKVPRMGAKAFEQSAGFLRITGGNPLDNSSIHPERYKLVEQMAKDLKCKVTDLFTNQDKLKQINVSNYICGELGLPTLMDILKELEKPGRDPRSDIQDFEFDDSIHSIDDLHAGMVVNGIVSNITQFGAFIDIGVHISGLLHISEMSERFIKSPSEIIKLNQQVRVEIKDIDIERKRISLTMKGIKQ